jgi:peroxiredoxin family protein
MQTNRKLSIICFSGDFDRVLAAFTLATGAAAVNWNVSMFFTFWGLNILKKDFGRRLLGKGLLDRLFNFLMGGRNNLPLSRLNFGGMSPVLMTGMMKKNNVATLKQLIEAAKELKINLIACEMAMNILGIKKEDLDDYVKEVIGVPTFLKYSEDAQVIFI